MTSTLRHLVDILIREVEPDRVILFGSRARGDNEERSDYDICVLKTGVTHRRKLAKQIYRLLYETLVDEWLKRSHSNLERAKAGKILIVSRLSKNQLKLCLSILTWDLTRFILLANF